MRIDNILVGSEKNIHRPVIRLVYIEEKRAESLCVHACVGCRRVMRLRYLAPKRLFDRGMTPTKRVINADGIHNRCNRCRSIASTKVMMIIVDK